MGQREYDISGFNPTSIDITDLEHPRMYDLHSSNSTTDPPISNNIEDECENDSDRNLNVILEDEIEHTENLPSSCNEIEHISEITKCVFVNTTNMNIRITRTSTNAKRKRYCGGVFNVTKGIRTIHRTTKKQNPNAGTTDEQSEAQLETEQTINMLREKGGDDEDCIIIFTVCRKPFVSTTTKARHVCKGARSSNDILSFAQNMHRNM